MLCNTRLGPGNISYITYPGTLPHQSYPHRPNGRVRRSPPACGDLVVSFDKSRKPAVLLRGPPWSTVPLVQMTRLCQTSYAVLMQLELLMETRPFFLSGYTGGTGPMEAAGGPVWPALPNAGRQLAGLAAGPSRWLQPCGRRAAEWIGASRFCFCFLTTYRRGVTSFLSQCGSCCRMLSLTFHFRLVRASIYKSFLG